MLQSLVGAEIGKLEAEAVLSACADTGAWRRHPLHQVFIGGVDLAGLVGLLLSAQATRQDCLGGLLLALDQHRGLLTGKGQLSDLLRVRVGKREVTIEVVEAKFSTGPLSLQSAAVMEAQQRFVPPSSGLPSSLRSPLDPPHTVAPSASNRPADPSRSVASGETREGNRRGRT